MIDVRNVSKNYGAKTIFQNINLEFQANQSYAIVGPSGSGKSTLLNLLARLEKASSGQVLIQNQDVWKLKEREYFSHYLGYVFQNYALIEEETVYANLKMLASKNKIVGALKQVGLDESFLTNKIYELSGGQAQRVSIARLLLKKAKVILADEPTGALDKKTGQDIIKLLLELVSPETVVIIATHDTNVFQQVDKVIDMSQLSN